MHRRPADTHLEVASNPGASFTAKVDGPKVAAIGFPAATAKGKKGVRGVSFCCSMSEGLKKTKHQPPITHSLTLP